MQYSVYTLERKKCFCCFWNLPLIQDNRSFPNVSNTTLWDRFYRNKYVRPDSHFKRMFGGKSSVVIRKKQHIPQDLQGSYYWKCHLRFQYIIRMFAHTQQQQTVCTRNDNSTRLFSCGRLYVHPGRMSKENALGKSEHQDDNNNCTKTCKWNRVMNTWKLQGLFWESIKRHRIKLR